MRGGNTDATLVLGTERLITPPTVSRAWAAIMLHHEYWPDAQARLEPGGIVVVDRSVFHGEIERDDLIVVDVEATDTAIDIGNLRPRRWSPSVPSPRRRESSASPRSRSRPRRSFRPTAPARRRERRRHPRRSRSRRRLRRPGVAGAHGGSGPMSARAVVTRGTVVIDVERARAATCASTRARPACS